MIKVLVIVGRDQRETVLPKKLARGQIAWRVGPSARRHGALVSMGTPRPGKSGPVLESSGGEV